MKLNPIYVLVNLALFSANLLVLLCATKLFGLSVPAYGWKHWIPFCFLAVATRTEYDILKQYRHRQKNL